MKKFIASILYKAASNIDPDVCTDESVTRLISALDDAANKLEKLSFDAKLRELKARNWFEFGDNTFRTPSYNYFEVSTTTVEEASTIE